MKPSTVMVADVGGTHLRLALADPGGTGRLVGDSVAVLPVGDFPDFARAARHWLEAVGARPQQAVLAFAGPLQGDAIHMTNHPWVIERAATARALGLQRLEFLNDFSAMALGVATGSRAQLQPLGAAGVPGAGARPDQVLAVLGPGTGLGVGALVLRAGVPLPLSGEGGHAGLAPRTALEVELVEALAARFGRVTNEHVLCGPGLVNLYRAWCAVHGLGCRLDSPRAVTAEAGRDPDSTAAHVLRLFCELLGSVAGDQVLTFGAWDGLYLAGGLALPVLPWLREGGFRRRFEDKGQHAALLRSVPVGVATDPLAGLRGAAAWARPDRGAGMLAARVAGAAAG